MCKPLVWARCGAAALLLAALASPPPVQASSSIAASRVEPYADTVNPGSSLSLSLSFRALTPTATPHRVQLQFLDDAGNAVFSTEHDPAQYGARLPSTAWAGEVAYTVPHIAVPAVAAGTYRIGVSLVDPATGARQAWFRRTNDLYSTPLSPTLQQVGLLTVTTKPIVDVRLLCNGHTDISRPLRRALDTLQPGTVLRLPAGTCVFSAVVPPAPDNCTDQGPLPLRLPYGARDITLVGRGMPSTTLTALNANNSALFADGVQGLVVRDLTLNSQSAGWQRQVCPVANGISVFNSQQVDIQRVLVSRSAAAGVLLFAVQDGRVSASRVQDTLADGIQATHGSRRIVVDNNTISRTGDDSVSSIGHVPMLNDTVTISGNTLLGSLASGVSVEGTSNAVVRGNTIQDTGVAGLRIASISSFKTGVVNGVVAADNTLTNVRRNATVDHAAVMIFADYGNVSNVTLSGNRIVNPQTGDGIRIRGSLDSNGSTTAYWASGITVTGNTLTDNRPAGLLRCIHRPLPSTTGTVVAAGNTLNGTACPAGE